MWQLVHKHHLNKKKITFRTKQGSPLSSSSANGGAPRWAAIASEVGEDTHRGRISKPMLFPMKKHQDFSVAQRVACQKQHAVEPLNAQAIEHDHWPCHHRRTWKLLPLASHASPSRRTTKQLKGERNLPNRCM